MTTLGFGPPERRRLEILETILGLVDGRALVVDNARNGWPAEARIRVGDAWMPVSLHVAVVGPSGRDRDHLERRIQNPTEKRPIMALPGAPPMVLGLWDWEHREGTPVLVAYDATKHVAVPGRLSIWVPVQILLSALGTGWRQGENSDGELLTAFWPSLTSAYFEVFAVGEPVDVGDAVEAVGAPPLLSDPGVERARTLVSRIVRDRRFGREVREAYGGRCAVCSLNFGLVEGAHIVPVEANGSDDLSNGLALCGNHHAAFDAHKMWVHPESRILRWHPEIIVASDAGWPLTGAASDRLQEPVRASARPTANHFERRHDYYRDAYSWTSKRALVHRGAR